MPPVDLKDLLHAKSALKPTEKPAILKDVATTTLPTLAMYKRDISEIYAKYLENVCSQIGEELRACHNVFSISLEEISYEFRTVLRKDIIRRLASVGFEESMYKVNRTNGNTRLIFEMDVDAIINSEPAVQIAHVCSSCKELDFEHVQKSETP